MDEFKLLLRKDIVIIINNIKLILKNPLRLLPYLIIVGYFGFFYVTGAKKRQESGSLSMDEFEELASGVEEINFGMQNLVGGITLLALAILMFQLYRASKKNISFFSMADVNLLFTSPAYPHRILIYYMVRSVFPALGGSLLFVLYSTAQLSEYYELDFLNISMMILGLTLFFFLIAPIRFLIYTLHTKYGILQYIKAGVFGLGVLLAFMIIIPGMRTEKFWQGMFSWIASPWFDFFPIVGWSRGIAAYIAHGNLFQSLGFILVYILTFWMLIKLVIMHAGYYYEDVLESTKSKEETKEQATGKREAKEGVGVLNAGKKLDLKDFGFGGVALFWRNYVHASRQDFHPLIGLYSLGFLAVGLVLAILAKKDVLSVNFLNGYLGFNIFMYFFAGAGRTAIGDLKKPFFFLIPASWYSKFINLIKLDVFQALLFGILLIIPAVLLTDLPLVLIPIYPICLMVFYLTGFGIAILPQIGFEEGWDRKLVKPLMIIGIIFFGVLPALGIGLIAYFLTKEFAFFLLGATIGMSLVAGVMLHVIMDVISRLEFKEL